MMKRPRNPTQIHEFRINLLTWFDAHKRDLPWRRTSDPYAIWVSEIMLQQTRVAAVLDHYANWMQKFPTVHALANASEDEVLTAWSGLGYYRRARFLHQGAKALVTEHKGKLPRTAVELRTLPGIGAYTSAAIASIAFGEASAVVDGNVERVVLRQTGCAEAGAASVTKAHASLSASEIQSIASQLIDPVRPGDFNQAMMELGATVCLPRNPLCLQCPVLQTCRTRGEHPTVKRKPGVSEDIAYTLMHRKRGGDHEVLLQQRPASATVMPGMWELPTAPSESNSTVPDPRRTCLFLGHGIMQTNYRVTVTMISAARNKRAASGQRWVRVDDLAFLPLTGLARKIFQKLEGGARQFHARQQTRILPSL